MTVPGTKLSQITLAGSPPALTDTLVGVGGGTTDFQYTLGQIKTALGDGPSLPFGSIQFNNGGALGGDAAFATPSVGTVTLGSLASATRGIFEFIAEDGTNVTIQPLPTTTNWTLSLPTDAGTNTWVLTTDGTGITSWQPPPSAGAITVGTTTITGGTTKHVAYDLAGVFQEAANFTIESGNPNVIAGNAYLYGGVNAVTSVFAASNDSNWFFGNAGNLTLTGTLNVGVGEIALSSLTSGTQNMAVGRAAGFLTTDGNNNVAIGANTLLVNSHGSDNIALGARALNGNEGNQNIAIGSLSMQLSATVSQNVAIGYTSQGVIAGDDNVSIGWAALSAGSATEANTAVGKAALFNLVSGGSHNVGIGYNALVGCNSGDNVAIGSSAASNVTSGTQNTTIGRSAGVISSGSQNIEIGYSVQAPSATANGQLSIGNFIYGTGLTGTGSTISSGKIGIGIKAPNFNLDVAGSLGCAEATAILHNSTTVTGGSTGNVPTLTAGPVTGNPTKWLPYDDNGTTRYIPSW